VPDPMRRTRLAAQRSINLGRIVSGLRQLRSAVTLERISPAADRLPRFTFSDDELTNVAYLVRLVELERTLRDRRRDPGRLPEVAAAFEDLARRLAPDAPRRGMLLVQAAAMWGLAGYQANAVVLARQFEAETSFDDDAAGRLTRLAAALLRRDVHAVERLAADAASDMARLGDTLVPAAGDESFEVGDAAVLAAYGLVGEASLAAGRFWRLGDRAATTEALSLLDEAADIVLQTNVVDTWLLVDTLRYVLEDSFSVSPWRRLRGAAPNWNLMWERHLRLLAHSDPAVVELWPSQLEALEAGFLSGDARTLAVRMPTSAGKTMLSELALLGALADPEERRLAVFVVPSRALAAEVEGRLSKTLGRVGLRVSALFGGFDHVDYELALLENTDVLVVTAEKLDLLLRQEPSVAERLAIAVVDEAHLVGEEGRGLGVELLVTRIRRRVPAARVLLLSAVLPNIEEIGQWLEPARNGANVAKSTWTPSRLIEGVFFWDGSPAAIGQTGTVRYPEDEFFLKYVLERTARNNRRNSTAYPKSRGEDIAELALQYQRIGPVLIGVATRRQCEWVTRAIAHALARRDAAGASIDLAGANSQQRLDRLSRLIESTAGADHPLAAYVRRGFGYHSADLPDAVRLELEAAFRDGALTVLAATSTLSQGVNLPAQTVIVGYTQRGGGAGAYIPVKEYRNLAGRAGRAFTETEGHVVLMASDRNQALTLRDRYINGTPERLESTLYGAYRYLALRRMPSLQELSDGTDIEVDDDPDTALVLARLDAQLLVLAAEEVVDTDDEAALEEFLGDTLCGVQARLDGVPLRPLGRFVGKRIATMKARVPDVERRLCYYRTGLALDSCEKLAEGLRAMIDADPTIVEPGRFADLRHALIAVATGTDEVTAGCQQRGLDVAAIVDVAESWIAGQSVETLQDQHGVALGTSGALDMAVTVERVVARDLPWVLSSCVELLPIELGDGWEPSRALAALPAMAKFGVGTVGACFAASSGVRRRDVARSLGDAFEVAAPGGSLRDYISWLAARDTTELGRLVPTDEVGPLVERVESLAAGRDAQHLLAWGSGTARCPIRGTRYQGRASRLEAMTVPVPVVLERQVDNPFDANAVRVRSTDGAELGYVARELAVAVASLMDWGATPTAALTNVTGTGGALTAEIQITF